MVCVDLKNSSPHLETGDLPCLELYSLVYQLQEKFVDVYIKRELAILRFSERMWPFLQGGVGGGEGGEGYYLRRLCIWVILKVLSLRSWTSISRFHAYLHSLCCKLRTLQASHGHCLPQHSHPRETKLCSIAPGTSHCQEIPDKRQILLLWYSVFCGVVLVP